MSAIDVSVELFESLKKTQYLALSVEGHCILRASVLEQMFSWSQRLKILRQQI